MRLLVVLTVLLASCSGAHKPPPPPGGNVKMDFSAPGYVDCAFDALPPSSADVCDGMYTKDGAALACVRCPASHACIDRLDVVYCVVGNDCSDPNCQTDDPRRSLKRRK